MATPSSGFPVGRTRRDVQAIRLGEVLWTAQVVQDVVEGGILRLLECHAHVLGHDHKGEEDEEEHARHLQGERRPALGDFALEQPDPEYVPDVEQVEDAGNYPDVTGTAQGGRRVTYQGRNAVLDRL